MTLMEPQMRVQHRFERASDLAGETGKDNQ
jgi:hypothetical protein